MLNTTEEIKYTQDENIDYIVNINKKLITNLIKQLKEKADQIHELHKLIDNNQKEKSQDIKKLEKI